MVLKILPQPTHLLLIDLDLLFSVHAAFPDINPDLFLLFRTIKPAIQTLGVSGIKIAFLIRNPKQVVEVENGRKIIIEAAGQQFSESALWGKLSPAFSGSPRYFASSLVLPTASSMQERFVHGLTHCFQKNHLPPNCSVMVFSASGAILSAANELQYATHRFYRTGELNHDDQRLFWDKWKYRLKVDDQTTLVVAIDVDETTLLTREGRSPILNPFLPEELKRIKREAGTQKIEYIIITTRLPDSAVFFTSVGHPYVSTKVAIEWLTIALSKDIPEFKITTIFALGARNTKGEVYASVWKAEVLSEYIATLQAKNRRQYVLVLLDDQHKQISAIRELYNDSMCAIKVNYGGETGHPAESVEAWLAAHRAVEIPKSPRTPRATRVSGAPEFFRLTEDPQTPSRFSALRGLPSNQR